VPVSVITSGTGVLVVHPSVAANTTRELIELARSQPGKLAYASQGNGTIAHLAGAMFDLVNNVSTVHVPYKGSAPAVTDIVAGQVQLLFSELATALPHINAGKLRALGVGATRRHPLLPAVPLLADTLPGFYFSYWTGMVAPPGTPAAIARRVSAEIAEGLKQPEMGKRVADASLEPMGTTPEETAAFFKAESERWGNVIRKTGTTGE
jgi:tripartite-type tricarboxylate transporter receptor subunit TctC